MKQFKKGGSLKKNAKAECGFMIGDVGEIEEVHKNAFFKNASEKLKKDYCNFASPYIFTHISAQKIGTGEQVVIFENVGQFMTTPKRLFELLTK